MSSFRIHRVGHAVVRPLLLDPAAPARVDGRLLLPTHGAVWCIGRD